MDNLPVEIAWNIFGRLSFRSLANCLCTSHQWRDLILQLKIYSSIHISSHQQLERFIDKANTPSPRSFHHIPYWYKNAYINKITPSRANHRGLKSLEIYIPFTSSFTSSSFKKSTIYLQPIGPVKSHPARHYSQDRNPILIDYRSKVLMIPKLHHLITLKIAFHLADYYAREYEFEMDERTLEAIHLSSPQLKHLHLFSLYMNISEDFDEYLISRNRASSLIELKINGGLFDGKCCKYFTLKYPNLESFDYTYSYDKIDGYPSQYLQTPFYNMITHFTALKRLALRSRAYVYENGVYWPHDDLLKWINEHPQKLEHLEYPDYLCIKPIKPSSTLTPVSSSSSISSLLSASSTSFTSSTLATTGSVSLSSSSTSDHQSSKNKPKLFNSSTTDIHTSEKKNHFQLHQSNNINLLNGLFIHHVTSLTVRSNQMNQTVADYLLYLNTDSTSLVLSTSIKEFKIYELKGAKKNPVYLLDWLEFFPKMQVFKAEYVTLMEETGDLHPMMDSIFDNSDYYYYYHHDKNDNDILHLLTLREKNHSYYEKKYKLTTLDLNHCGIKYKNGFNGLLSKFYQLNQLFLHYIDYMHYDWYGNEDLPSNWNGFSININHLSIHHLSITNISIHPWKHIRYYKERTIKKIQLNELLTNKNVIYYLPQDTFTTSGRYRRTHRTLDSYQLSSYYFIQLNCKYIEHLVFY
ncbi:unnamed protein product [Cunninghamella blakesleeana]